MKDNPPRAKPAPVSRARRKTLYGVAISLGSFTAARMLNLVITILLARSLQPEGMGTVAFALLCVEIIDMLRDFGLRETLVYSRDRSPVVETTAFVLMLVIGIGQGIALFLFAPLAHLVSDDPEIVPMLMWLSLLFPLSTLGSVQDSMLQRSLRFGPSALAETSGVCVKAVVAIGLLYAGAGIYSIVAGILCGSAARAAALWAVSDWRPSRVRPSLDAARSLFGYGRHIVVSNIFSALRVRSDQMAIVTMISDVALGVYYVAARIPEIVVVGVNMAVTRVIFPTFAGMADDPDRLRAAYLATIHASMTVMAPITIGLSAVSGLLVPALFGLEWNGAVPVLTFLALRGLPQSLGWTAGDFLKGTGRPQGLAMLIAIETFIFMPALWSVAYLTRDVVAVAATMLGCELAAALLRLWYMGRIGAATIGATLGAAYRAIISASVMGAALLFLISATQGLNDWIRMAICVSLGTVVYVTALFIIDRDHTRKLAALVFRPGK